MCCTNIIKQVKVSMSDISIVSNLQIMRLETRKSVPEHASIYQSQQYKPAWFFKKYIYIYINNSTVTVRDGWSKSWASPLKTSRATSWATRLNWHIWYFLLPYLSKQPKAASHIQTDIFKQTGLSLYTNHVDQ